jgi:hypothetical protein
MNSSKGNLRSRVDTNRQRAEEVRIANKEKRTIDAARTTVEIEMSATMANRHRDGPQFGSRVKAAMTKRPSEIENAVAA